MAGQSRTSVRYSNSPVSKKIKMGGTTVLSRALVKPGATNLTPKIHVKRGDMVMLISGPKKKDPKRDAKVTKRLDERNAYKGTTGKVTAVFPEQGKILVEGVNMLSTVIKPKMGAGKSTLVRQEAPIFASKVMLYSAQSKKPVRAEFRKREGLE